MKIGEIDMKKIIVGSTLILGISLLLIGYLYQNRLDMEKQNRLAKEKALEENILKKKIKEAYHEKVVTNKDTSLEISKCDFGKEIYISNILEEEIKSVIDGKVNLRKSEISTISIR